MTLFALGIYNVGRTLSDAIGQAILQLGEFIVFPTIAAFRGEKDELTRKLRAARRRMLVPAALGLATVAAFSPLLVFTLYDSRYHSAALVAPALMVAVWPTLLSIIAEMVMRGIGKSAPGASGNAAKLATLVLAMPIGFLKGGMLGALLAMNLAEWLRYAAIASAARRSGISFLRDDTRLTLLFASVAGGLIMLVAHGWLGIGMADIRQWAGSFTR
jgi:O-antigen/teichoic acid export membrane protein